MEYEYEYEYSMDRARRKTGRKIRLTSIELCEMGIPTNLRNVSPLQRFHFNPSLTNLTYMKLATMEVIDQLK